MKKIGILTTFIALLLSSCTNLKTYGFSTANMRGLNSPFTENCTSLRVQVEGFDTTISVNDVRGQFAHIVDPKTMHVVAKCYKDTASGRVETGVSILDITNPRTSTAYVGSSEGSTAAQEFAKMAKVSGVFPIVAYTPELLNH